MARTITVTETITRHGIDPPPPTSIPFSSTTPGLDHATTLVGIPAFFSTTKFIMTIIAIFLATAAVTYLVLQTKSRVLRFYAGKKAKVTTPEEDKAEALVAARCVTLSHVLTVLVLVTRTREALYTLAPIAYEVCTLVLGMEAAVSVVVAGIWVLIKATE